MISPKVLTLPVLLLSATISFSQSQPNGSYNFKGDPANAFNKHMVMKNERSYRQIGVYKVLGTPFLFGENHVGNMYSKSEVAKNIKLSFDTYNQELAFQTSANVNQPLVKGPGSLDSFMLKADSFIKEDMVFHYGGLLGTSDKSYYLLSSDPSKNLVLYKKIQSSNWPHNQLHRSGYAPI